MTWQQDDLEQVSCDFCKRFETRNLFLRPDGMQVVECCHCGLVYLNPRPKPKLIPRLYDRDYFSKTTGENRVGYAADYLGNKNRLALMADAEGKLRLLKGFWNPQGARCLEVGCATGEFSHVLRQNGAVPLGLDLSEFVISEARKNYPEIEFRAGSIEQMSGISPFDAIFAFELIEHVLSPTDFFKQAGRLLKPGGYLILSTPNLDCAKAIGCERWLGFQISFEHLYFFTADTLRQLGEPHGLVLCQWFTGAGDGVFQPPPEPRLKAQLRKMLLWVGLLQMIRGFRRRTIARPQTATHTNEGRQHNLLVVFQKTRISSPLVR